MIRFVLDSIDDFVSSDTGFLWIIGSVVAAFVGILGAFFYTHECARYETEVKDTYPVFVKIGFMMVPVGGGRKEVTTCAEWRKR